MYSQKGDVVLDPFMGTGTTAQAAILLGRNSVGYEIDQTFSSLMEENIDSLSISDMNGLIKARYDKHLAFVDERTKTHGALKHRNNILNCEVMTAQEEDLKLHYLKSVDKLNSTTLEYEVEYEDTSDMNQIPREEGRLF
jgi:hypothetical protein